MELLLWKSMCMGKRRNNFFDDFREARLKKNRVGPYFFGSVGLHETNFF